MKKKLVLILLLLIAVVLEALPNGTVMYFGNPEGDPFKSTCSYFDPIHWGYADFAPNLVAVLTCALLVLAILYLFVEKARLHSAILTLALFTFLLSLVPFFFSSTHISTAVSLLLAAVIVLNIRIIGGKHMKKEWNIPQDGENYAVTVEYTLFLGKMKVSVNDATYVLPNKFLTGLFGRKESFMLGEKLAILRIKPFGKAELTTAGGKY